MVFGQSLKRIALPILLLSTAGCFGSYPDDTTTTANDPTSGDPTFEQTSCGAVVDGKYTNPIATTDEVPVSLSEIVSSNLLILRSAQGENLLVRVHGLNSGAAVSKQASVTFIQGFGVAYFVPAGCTESVSGGGTAAVGSVLNYSGESLAEGLTQAGLTTPNTGDSCGGADLGQCLSALGATDVVTAGELDRFLWKPVSDSNGNLAVHVGPYGATVVINGETGVNQGPGNGYGDLVRFSRGGCGYPSPRIQVFSSNGFPYTVGGKTTFTVPNPCGRYCVENGDGNVFACSK